MISTKPKETKLDEVFNAYIKLSPEDRSKFLAKSVTWLTKKIEEDNKKRAEQSNK